MAHHGCRRRETLLRTDLMNTSILQEEIAAWVQAGHGLDEIEAGLIDPAPVGDDNRAALWLYAWALRDGGGIRRRGVRRFEPQRHRAALSAVN
jgi:hypothetical protein